jgi:hypothetical protein
MTSEPVTSSSPTLDSECHWRILWRTVGVYEEPNVGSAKIDTKRLDHADEVDVFGSCPVGADEFIRVLTPKAIDGVGWIRRVALRGPIP